MSRKRKRYTPAYRHEAARLVIDTGRRSWRWPARSGWVRPCWGAGWPRSGPARIIRRAWSTPTSGPSWNGFGGKNAELKMDREFLKNLDARGTAMEP
jgi:hypothetical protein